MECRLELKVDIRKRGARCCMMLGGALKIVLVRDLFEFLERRETYLVKNKSRGGKLVDIGS